MLPRGIPDGSPTDGIVPPAEAAESRDARPEARASNLPKLWAGRRRRHLSLLVVSGLGQAAAAGVGALLLSQVLGGAAVGNRRLVLFAVLLAAAVAIGALRMAERTLAERLSQDYVHEIRLGLIRRNLADGRVKSIGVAVTRTTNDLSSVKGWISQGVAPLAVGIPLILGATVALMLLEPLLAVGLLVPLLALLVAMRALAPIAYHRSRKLRRQRGLLSSQVADTILSTAAIRSAGGSDWELRRIEKHSGNLVTAAINRAKIAGALRGVAAATSGVATALVVGTGLVAGLPTHTIAGALIIVGFLATPIHDLGRVVEFRQTYRAARRIIGPAIEPATDTAVGTSKVAQDTDGTAATGGVAASGLQLSNGQLMPDLLARPGDRVVVDLGDRRLTSDLLDQLVGLREVDRGKVFIYDRDLSLAGPKDLRRLVGYAAQGMMLVRGSVSRTVRYRSPDTVGAEVDRLLMEVGLADRVAVLPQGVDTVLVRGGEPLTIPERARLLLARAMLNDPPLLVFDHVDSDLGTSGRDMMCRLLVGYPGVVILASDDADQIVSPTHVWRPEPDHLVTPPTQTTRQQDRSPS